MFIIVRLVKIVEDAFAETRLHSRHSLEFSRLAGEMLSELAGLLLQQRALFLPDLDDPREQLLEVFRRKIGASKERLSIRQEPGRERPPATLVHRLHGIHVDPIDIRPLLTVDLDRDKMLVEISGDFLVLKGLPLHNVTPVTG